MSKIEKLNNAILRIKAECASHENCIECPLKVPMDDKGNVWCIVEPPPIDWEEIEEEENGKD